MAQIGKRGILRVIRAATPGVFLDGGELGEILLPNRYVPPGTIPGEAFDVFVHRDSEDRIVATTEKPYAEVGDFAFLRAITSNAQMGAFLDWGLSKDLLLPIREQAHFVAAGSWVVAYVFLDERTDRIVASTKLNRFLNLAPPDYTAGQAVRLMVIDSTELGYNAIIEGKHRGLLYHSDIKALLTPGQELDGFVRAVREDGKIDLSLDAAGYTRVAPLADRILETLATHDGFLPLSDESSPEDIRAMIGSSKKAFKQAIGALYKQRQILIEEDGIRLLRKTK